jgi:hypothetical protein
VKNGNHNFFNVLGELVSVRKWLIIHIEITRKINAKCSKTIVAQN